MSWIDTTTYLIILLTYASWIFWILALVLTFIFFKRQRDPISFITPPVSILVPVKGVDEGAYENFASYCQQDYPLYELLIGINDEDDPAIRVVEQVQNDFPLCHLHLFIAQPLGANRKAAMLYYLADRSSYPIIVAVDSDMRVTPDYLRRVTAPLADPQIGLVTCSYQGIEPKTLAAKFEGLNIGASFLPLVMVARQFLSMRFAMGATIAMRRSVLKELGGFQSVVDYLADDYQMGLRTAQLGYQVYLSRYVITDILGTMTFLHYWQRQVRIATTNRVCRPVEYPIQLLYFSIPLSLMWMFITHFSPYAINALIISILLRWWVAWSISYFTGSTLIQRWMIWLPIQDILNAAAWVMGLFCLTVDWRGRKYRVYMDGRFAPTAEAQSNYLEISDP